MTEKAEKRVFELKTGIGTVALRQRKRDIRQIRLTPWQSRLTLRYCKRDLWQSKRDLRHCKFTLSHCRFTS